MTVGSRDAAMCNYNGCLQSTRHDAGRTSSVRDRHAANVDFVTSSGVGMIAIHPFNEPKPVRSSLIADASMKSWIEGRILYGGE